MCLNIIKKKQSYDLMCTEVALIQYIEKITRALEDVHTKCVGIK